MFSRYWWVLLTGFVVGPVVGFLIAALITYMMPKLYESMATLEIKSRRSDSTTSSVQPAPNHIANEMGEITARPVLEKAVDSMDFANKWAVDKEAAIEIVKGAIRIESIRGTDLVSVSARFTNKEDARDIVASVLASYKEYRESLLSESLTASSNGLRKAVREQEEKVEERRKILTLIAQKGDSSDVGKQDYVDAKRNFETELALLEQIKLKLITAEIAAGLSDTTIVVHEAPVIADAPTSYNVRNNLILGIAGGFALSPLLTLPMMWLLSRRKQIA